MRQRTGRPAQGLPAIEPESVRGLLADFVFHLLLIGRSVMAGRPKTRARRAQEARGKKRFDGVAREAVLKRAEEVGTAAAAAEVGVPPATVRTWRKRRADAPVPAGVSLPDESVGGAEGVVSGSRVERLRARAEKARAAQHRAEDRADAMIGTGQAAEARNAMVSATGFAERAAEMEAGARAEELGEVELAQAEGELLLEMIDTVFVVIGVELPREVVAHVLAGEVVPAEVAEAAREGVWRRLRSSVEAEIEQKFVSRHSPPEPEVDPEREESEPPDAGSPPAVLEEVANEEADRGQARSQHTSQVPHESLNVGRQRRALEETPVGERSPLRTGRVPRDPPWHAKGGGGF